MSQNEVLAVYDRLFAASHQDPDASSYVEESWQTVKKRYPLISFEKNLGDQVGPGWWALLEEAFQGITSFLETHPGITFEVAQIKEKFGGLRFYCDYGRRRGAAVTAEEFTAACSELDAFVYAAEVKSVQTCEVCGKPGEQRDNGWIKTLCDEHDAVQKKIRAARGY